jgi:hypothetical protein
VPLLDRAVRPFSRFSQSIAAGFEVIDYLWYGLYVLTLIAAILLGLG